MIGDLMCECFKPAYSDYDFGYGLGVLGDQMSEEEDFAVKLFSGSELHSFGLGFENEDYLKLLDLKIHNLKAELLRAGEEPFQEIPAFRITWNPAKDFQEGYVAGLNQMLGSLTGLGRLLTSEENSASDYFEDIIFPWAEKWQETNTDFCFQRAPRFAEIGLLGSGDELRILSSTKAWMITDGQPSVWNEWLEVQSPGLSTAETIVSELWSKFPPGDGQGLYFSTENHFSGPKDSELESQFINIEGLCDKHQLEVVASNYRFLNEAGISAELGKN